MEDALTTVVTERGQVSIPASVRRAMGLVPGQRLVWQCLSSGELRAVVIGPVPAGDPSSVLGFLTRLQPPEHRTTDEIMAEIREGERGIEGDRS